MRYLYNIYGVRPPSRTQIPQSDMAFIAAAVVDADFGRMRKYTDETGGTLPTPLVLATWPTSSPDETARRNAWSIEQQRWQFHNDLTARFMKVEDATTGEIVSLARWHR